MALSLRKVPKFRRKDYQRLGYRRHRDCTNEFVSANDEEGESAIELPIDSSFELSESSARNRLHRCANGDQKDSSKRDRTNAQEFLTYEIQPDDTLQGIALKYGCTVSELKRVNNLFQDQDAYALRQIRIPAREHSILFEIFSEAGSSSGTASSTSKTFHVSINQMMQNSDKEPSQFLKEMDRDIQRMVQIAQNHQSLEISQQTLNSSPIVSPLSKPYYDGANWGINWYWLLIALLVISVLAPVTFGIYYATMANNSGEQNSKNGTYTDR